MIPIIWTHYTATIRGSVLKVVPCENCSTEYVYLMEREASGGGTSVYMLREQGAREDAVGSAKEILKTTLENDFDTIPCPACGHYQRYMFPRLLELKKAKETKGLFGQLFPFVLLVAGCISVLAALRCTLAYFQGPQPDDFRNMIVAWSVVSLPCLIGLGLMVGKRKRDRQFNPNSEDQQSRVAAGRRRAVTRAEFEESQRSEVEGSRVRTILQSTQADQDAAPDPASM